MSATPRSTVGTVKSWNSNSTSTFTETEGNSSHKGIEEVEAARLRPMTNDQFPWLSQEFEPIRGPHGGRGADTRNPPTWFREGQTFNRGDSRRSQRSVAREEIVDLHLIVSDLDYYAGAVHDYQQAEEEEAEFWDEEARLGTAGPYPKSSDRDGTTFGQIQIIRAASKMGQSKIGSMRRNASMKSAKAESDSNLVTWETRTDPENPKNWTNNRKWLATLTVSLFTFISPVSSSMIAPALLDVQTSLGVDDAALAGLAMSVFILGFAVGPLLLGPLSEIYGRRVVLQASGMFYFIFNLAAGFSTNIGMLIAFRFLSGLGGSAPMGIGGGVLADIWLPQERGRAMALYSLMPLLGPAVGPIAGGFIAQYSSWRWVFWSTSIVAIIVQVMGYFLLHETYAATILQKKKNYLVKKTGNKDLYTEFENPKRSMASHLGTAFKRPIILLTTQPIVQLMALYIGYVYGVLYLVLASFPEVWREQYNETNTGIAGLNYISLGIGFYAGTQIAANFADKIYKNLKAQNSDVGRSEFRVPLMLPGAVMVPVGLLLYGWSAQNKLHWIVPNIGTAIFAAGNQLVFQNCQTYIVDSYTRYAASAIAATAVFRSLGGFAFPLFAHQMYSVLGYGWGNSVLAFLGIVVGLPVPFILWWYGEGLRKRSTFAVG